MGKDRVGMVAAAVTMLSVIPLAAAGPPLARASTETAVRSGRVIHYVSLGDSASISVPSFVDKVATRVGVTLHGKVAITRTFEDGTVAVLAARIESTPAIRSAIRAADLITITIGVNEIARAASQIAPNGCGSGDGSACVRRAEKEFERSYATLLSELTRLRPASKVAYRLLTSYDLPGVLPAAKGVVLTASLRAENRFICAQVLRRGMKCVDVYAAFNGADGSRDPRAAGLAVPDGHPSAKGATTIARAIVATGFAPLR